MAIFEVRSSPCQPTVSQSAWHVWTQKTCRSASSEIVPDSTGLVCGVPWSTADEAITFQKVSEAATTRQEKSSSVREKTYITDSRTLLIQRDLLPPFLSPPLGRKEEEKDSGPAPSLNSWLRHLATLSPGLFPLTLQDKHSLSRTYVHLGNHCQSPFLQTP